MPEQPLKWTLHSQPVGPFYRTAPGGWLILWDPNPETPDRPWSLHRHGLQVERCHTLRIAQLTADRMTANQTRTPA